MATDKERAAAKKRLAAKRTAKKAADKKKSVQARRAKQKARVQSKIDGSYREADSFISEGSVAGQIRSRRNKMPR